MDADGIDEIAVQVWNYDKGIWDDRQSSPKRQCFSLIALDQNLKTQKMALANFQEAPWAYPVFIKNKLYLLVTVQSSGIFLYGEKE
jgi:hypothetical protein